MTQQIKFGLLEYETENIGDEVQSIAARRFLPKIDYYFNRDNINATNVKPHEKVKLIMNGWYTHHPENWPPQIPNLEPLLIAMHVEQDALGGTPATAFKSPESKKFLNKFGPVGARDYSTLSFLKENNIDAYFSSCITLTLMPDPKVKKQNFILAVDVPDSVFETMQQNTDFPILRLDTNRKKNLDRTTKFALAEFWLYLYQSARAIITPRLHTMLPCLALGTPVLALSGRDPKRYEGLLDLVNHTTPEEYIKTPSIFNLNTPPKNPKKYLEFRDKLVKQCASFTGYDSQLSYLNGKKPQELLSDLSLLQFFLDSALNSWTLEETEKRLAHEASQPLKNPGIKKSFKLFAEAIQQKLTKS